MNVRNALYAAGLTVFGIIGVAATDSCKKTPSGGGSGGGGWVVGADGLMAGVNGDGAISQTYHFNSAVTLNSIACRFLGEAWVVGDGGTVLYTSDAGNTWATQHVPVQADLYALATQDSGPVYVAGDGVFLTSSNTGASWTQITEPVNFRSLAAAQDGDTVLAVSSDGGVWSYAGGALTRLATVAGANAIALSPDGETAVIAGNGLALSTDAGHTWTTIAVSAELQDVAVLDDDGTAVAVGDQGAIAQLSFGNVSLQHVGTMDLHTVHITTAGDYEEQVGIAAGDDGQLLVSHDGGWTWANGVNLGHTVLGVDQIGAGHR